MKLDVYSTSLYTLSGSNVQDFQSNNRKIGMCQLEPGSGIISTSNSIFSLWSTMCIRVIRVVSIIGVGWGPADKTLSALTTLSFDAITNITAKFELK